MRMAKAKKQEESIEKQLAPTGTQVLNQRINDNLAKVIYE